MRIILDENIPRPLKNWLTPHFVNTVQEIGWSGVSNGDLIDKAERIFDLLSTSEKSSAVSKTCQTEKSRSLNFQVIIGEN